jgi:hypothetical protein
MSVGTPRKALVHAPRRVAGGAGAAVLIALQAAGPASAQPGDAAQTRFAQTYMAAIRSQDPAKVRALQHPASRACLNEKTRGYFEWGFANELATGAMTAGPFRVSRFGPVGAQTPLGFLPPGAFTYPVRPTHEMQIDTQSREHQQVLLVRELARVNGTWFLVDPCPNAAGLKFFAEQKALGDRQRAESLRLVAAMPEPLRRELGGLVAQGQTIGAAHRYQAATGADLTTAVGVVEQLREPD